MPAAALILYLYAIYRSDSIYMYPFYPGLTVDRFGRRILQPASDQILGQPEPRMIQNLKNPNEAASVLVRRVSPTGQGQTRP